MVPLFPTVRQQVKIRAQLLVLAIVTVTLPTAYASPPPELCKVLRSFVEAVQPDEEREFTFRTSWGTNFKNAKEPALFAKRCSHDGYEPAKSVCAYLMEHGSVEFAGINVKDSVSCLSRKTKFASSLRLNGGEFSFSYGSDHQGALIDITFQEDEEVGGMAFRLEVDGY